MSTQKTKKTQSAAQSANGAFDAAVEQFATVADMVKGGLDAALDAGAEQTRAAYAFEGLEFVGRENVDAALKSSEACFAGAKDLSALWFKAAKDAARFNADAAQSFSACKSVEDLTQAQMALASNGFGAAMAVANGFVEAFGKVSGDVSAPLKTQFGQFGQFGSAFTPFWMNNKVA